MKARILGALWDVAVHVGMPTRTPRLFDALEQAYIAAMHLGDRARFRRGLSELEAQRRSFAFGQVAMHDPTLTRAQVDAIADTMPAPGNSHCHGCGRVAEHGIAGWYLEPGPFFRLWCPDCDAPFDFLCGEGPELEAEAGEEHAAMVDLHGADVWPHSGDGRKGWCA